MVSESSPKPQPAESAARPPVEDFAHRVAHDLRNVLNNFNLNLQFLEMTLDLSEPKAARAMERMRDEVAKFRNMVDEIPRKARDGWE